MAQRLAEAVKFELFSSLFGNTLTRAEHAACIAAVLGLCECVGNFVVDVSPLVDCVCSCRNNLGW